MTDTILPQASRPASSGEPPRPGRSRLGRSRPVLIAVVVAFIAVAGIGGFELLKPSSSNSPRPPSPVAQANPATSPSLRSLLSQVMANAAGTKFVHTDVTLNAPHHPLLSYSDDDGVTGGIQRVRIANGERAVVVVVGRTTYVSGNRSGLSKFFGMGPAQVDQVLGGWIRLVPGDKGYASVTTGVTLASTLKEMRLTGPLTRLPARALHGRRVFGIRGAVAASKTPTALATLWIAVGLGGLPVEYDSTVAGSTEIARFSNWGTPVIAHVPAGPTVGSGALPA